MNFRAKIITVEANENDESSSTAKYIIFNISSKVSTWSWHKMNTKHTYSTKYEYLSLHLECIPFCCTVM